MLVSHNNHFIYLKTRKTAGTSILAYLEPCCSSEGETIPKRSPMRQAIESEAGIIGFYQPSANQPWWNHMPASDVKARLGPIWESYTKVCCIRNPFDKVFSFFWWAHPSFASDKPDDAMIKAKFRAWLLASGDLAMDRDMHTIDGLPCIDAYIRYETLLADLESFCRTVGIAYDPERLARHKGQIRPVGLSFRGFYDQETADRVISAYDKEFDWFSYTRDWR